MPDPTAESSAPTPQRARKALYLAAGILVITLAVFWGATRAQFVQWDDDVYIYGNPHIQGLNWERVVWMFTHSQRLLYYAPLGWLSLALVHSVGGLNPFAYHLANVLLHGISAALLFFIVRKILRTWCRLENGSAGILPASAIATLFWALHPLRVEPVAWANGFFHDLALLFILAATLSFLRARRTGKAQWWIAASVSYTVSLLCFPIGFSLPAVLFLLDVFLPGNAQAPAISQRLTRGLMRLIPFAVPAVAVLLVAAYRRLHAQGIWPEATTLEQFGITERLAQGFYIWFYYLCKSVAPFNLSPVYTKLFWFNPFDWPFLLSTVAVVGLTGFLVYQRRRFPGACLVWVSYLILLVPFQGWFEHPHYSSDRYSLLPHIPLAIAVAFIVYRGLMSRWNTTVLSASAILLCITVLTLRQIPIWQNSRHLFHHILAHVGASPYRADISFRLATWEDAQGNRARAIQHYLETLAVAPHFVKGRLHLVMALIAEGRIEEAITHYKAGLQSDPNNVQMLNDLAWLRATQPNPAFRDGAEAVQLATRACELTRYQVPLCMGTLAASYAEAGRFEDAIATARKAAALARAEGQTNLVLKTEELIELYSARTAYRDTVE